MSTPHPTISHRKTIRWPPAPASEPTDTLVLTSARHRLYVDIRVLKTPRQLDWAFAGISRSQAGADGLGHARWLHWLDSQSAAQATGEYVAGWRDGGEDMWERARDRGMMWTSPDGEELESGEMVRPETGRVAGYEEVWEGVEARREREGKVACVAMTVEEEGAGRMGVVMRVG